jgi:hypothetical protein
MLLKKNITDFSIMTDEWRNSRLGKFTSSEIHYLMGAKGIGEGGLSYIYRKVGESVSGIAARDEVTTAATVHGNTYELEAIKRFGLLQGQNFPVIQRMIFNEETGYASTPDAIWIEKESTDGLAYMAKTIECKCPYSYDGYIRLWKCKTALDVKKEFPAWYWQVIDQLSVCDCLHGFLVCFQPYFKVGQIGVVEFRKIDLVADFKLLTERKALATEIFNNTRNEMLADGTNNHK